MKDLFKAIEATIRAEADKRPGKQLDVNLVVGTLLSLAAKFGALQGMTTDHMIAALQSMEKS